MWFHTASREYEDVRYLGETFSNSIRAFYDENEKFLVYYLDIIDPFDRGEVMRLEYGREEMGALLKALGTEISCDDAPSCEVIAPILTAYIGNHGVTIFRHEAWCHCRDWQ